MNQIPQSISELTLVATPSAVAWARRHTVNVLRRWRFSAEAIEVARLLVSGLTTNAIQHTKLTETSETAAVESARPGTIVLSLWPTDGGIVLAVSDPDPRPPLARTDDASATGGRGLILVQAMASRWGYYQPGRRAGKVVWAEVLAHPSAAVGESGAGHPQSVRVIIRRVLTGLREL
ncbi:ATP-binding protein [Streptomyces sp. FIT100]|uniref:ATP-binding protein n=1 Tax=Streptomyces sp. FIT100 TaxID=2837956 RepID=UPI0021C78E76|nr:ATP-binding protein [Streptomyces sp. FIT100]UUN27559.1 ATP-binding protein [Streptomyces sp. FIT100]